MRAKADAARRNGDDTRERLLSGTSVQACFACGSPLTPRRYREVEAKRGEFIEQIRATLILERDAEIEQIRIEAAAQVAKTKADVAEREAAIRKDAATTATAALMDKITKSEQARKAAEQQIKNLKADQDAALKARLEAERETAAKKLAEAVTAEKVKAFEE